MATAIVVEDDASMRYMLQSTLGLAGHEVLAAVDSGAEALKYLKAGQVPDIVFLDMILPGGLGSEIIGYIREHHKGVKIFMVTGLTEKQILGLVPPGGCDDIIYKPFGVPELMRRVERLLAPQEPG